MARPHMMQPHTAGRAHTAVTGDIAVCGVALAADVANVAPVFVYKQF